MAEFCTACGTARPPEARFCSTCGARFDTAVCPMCGHELGDAKVAAPTRGSYTSEVGTLYFDGSAWFAAREVVPGVVVPVSGRPIDVTVVGTARPVLLRAEEDTSIEAPPASTAPAAPGVTPRPPAQPPAAAQPHRPTPSPPLVAAGVPAAGPPAGLPRGPVPGPDYQADRDCGNCGFPRPTDPDSACSRCGSTDTGPDFHPGR